MDHPTLTATTLTAAILKSAMVGAIWLMSTPVQAQQDTLSTDGPIIAQLEEMKPCTYSSGGRPSTNSHHVCEVKYSLTNAADETIKFDNGLMVYDEKYPGWGHTEGSIGYARVLKPGDKMDMKATCYIAHKQSAGGLLLSGGGHFLGETEKNTIKWSLALTCPQ